MVFIFEFCPPFPHPKVPLLNFSIGEKFPLPGSCQNPNSNNNLKNSKYVFLKKQAMINKYVQALKKHQFDENDKQIFVCPGNSRVRE